jgi:hypothetical protein
LLDYDLFSEEAQYWLWSKHLDFSYYSKPPLIAYMNFISTAIFGDTELGVRINALIAGFLLPVLVYNFANELFLDNRIAYYSTLLLIAMPFYHIISLIFTTDTLVVLFWTSSIIFFYRAINSNKIYHWILTGLFSGLAVLSKYTGVLFFPFIIIYAFIYRRKLLSEPGLYYSFLIAAIVCTPMVIWIVKSDFVSFQHLFDLTGSGSKATSILKPLKNIAEYIGGQILSLSPFFVLTPIILLFKRKELSINEKDKKVLNYIFIPLLFSWILFLPISVNGIEVNWLFFTYASVPIILGYLYFKYINKIVFIFNFIVSAVFILLFFNPYLIDMVNAEKIYPPEIDTFKRLTGWSELGKQVEEIMDEYDETNTIIVSDLYQICSQLSFYVDENPQTYCVNNGRRMNQFDLWGGLENFQNKDYYAVYVSRKIAPEALRISFNEELEHKVFITYYRDKVHRKYHIYVFGGIKHFTNNEFSKF